MDAILAAHAQQEKRGNLSKAIDDVQSLIDLLQSTRDAVAEDPDKAVLHLAKLSTPVKQSFSKIEEDLKEVNRGINQYSKALKDKFKSTVLPTNANDALVSQPHLINRAIAMHLLREGKFDVAKTFVREGKEHPPGALDAAGTASSHAAGMDWIEDLADADETMQDSGEGSAAEGEKSGLQQKFADMYHILDALRNQHNLEPAIDWAHHHSHDLERRGSNLEFELSRLKFVELYHSKSDEMTDGDPDYLAGPVRALEYARRVFPTFGERYSRETSSLSASLAFSPNLQDSPFHALFHNQSAFEEASTSFTREFCGMLGLSSQSPLYTAVTAGGIALPVFEKFERVMAQTRGQWTSVNELPVETPLPPGYAFHSIFVCPVSKDQATDANPPMMLPCGHVLAKESLDQHSKGKSRMKCPYCPQECHPRDAKRVYI
ncbi:hypothetical protein CERZMDRAFT_35212 [Cercospora zeae-maydis SCOH1-5]|uniref:GID complex catalytic subunit 2 n=1 Tax=Cercospora zeae-maydis SCOH1-5 TaxID=717836 RepID=A0A6A6FQF7_9PEZI|nr:hypothetical protein CERZMDRAFT_35212 [Cercospora zeae-maydis SCOH1-5]